MAEDDCIRCGPKIAFWEGGGIETSMHAHGDSCSMVTAEWAWLYVGCLSSTLDWQMYSHETHCHMESTQATVKITHLSRSWI